MQTHAFAKNFSHFHLWTVKRLQKAARANSPHLRQIANCALSSLILTIQQTVQPFNGHIDPKFQQLNSTCILWKHLRQTALTPLHTRSHCKGTESRRIHGLLADPRIWNYFGCCSVWLCCVKGEGRREQTRTNTVCSTLAGPGTGSVRLPNIVSAQTVPGMVTVPQRWQHSKQSKRELEEEDRASFQRKCSLPASPLLLKVWNGCLVLTQGMIC